VHIALNPGRAKRIAEEVILIIPGISVVQIHRTSRSEEEPLVGKESAGLGWHLRNILAIRLFAEVSGDNGGAHSERLLWANDMDAIKKKAATTGPTLLNLTFLNMGLLTALICKFAVLHRRAKLRLCQWDASAMGGRGKDCVNRA
jgi:hypothetical protein